MSVWNLDKQYLNNLKEKELLRMETLFENGGMKAKTLSSLPKQQSTGISSDSILKTA